MICRPWKDVAFFNPSTRDTKILLLSEALMLPATMSISSTKFAWHERTNIAENMENCILVYSYFYEN